MRSSVERAIFSSNRNLHLTADVHPERFLSYFGVRPFLFRCRSEEDYFIATFVEDTDREERSKKCRTNKFLVWLKAKARVTDAEERLSDMFDKAESFLRSLRDQPSIPFDPNNWPEDSAVAAALRERREAQRAFDQANAALSPADRKLLKSIPTDFLMTSSFPGRLESDPALGTHGRRFNCLRASIRHSAQSGTAAPANQAIGVSGERGQATPAKENCASNTRTGSKRTERMSVF